MGVDALSGSTPQDPLRACYAPAAPVGIEVTLRRQRARQGPCRRRNFGVIRSRRGLRRLAGSRYVARILN